MIDAKYFTEYELQRTWEAHVRGCSLTPITEFDGDTIKRDFIDLPGVGVVGNSSRPEDICVTCTVGKHGECSKFTTHGDMCQCPCGEEAKR